MRTIYQCERCSQNHSTEGLALRCELVCGIAQSLCHQLADCHEPISERWSPPPLVGATKWKIADQKELARRVVFALKGLEDKMKHLNQIANLKEESCP